MTDFRGILDQTARSMSTPLLRKMMQDFHTSKILALGQHDAAAVYFLETAIVAMQVEIARREKTTRVMA